MRYQKNKAQKMVSMAFTSLINKLCLFIISGQQLIFNIVIKVNSTTQKKSIFEIVRLCECVIDFKSVLIHITWMLHIC